MGQVLYRKYRPKSLDDVVGQDHITTVLKNALKSKKLSHAYLFTGPRGLGKTSVARILAHEVNGLPYTDDSLHLDIIEIDAASNRRIDEIRELRDKVNIAPTSSPYKVYIIDEVHMLTKEAFNALLKTLEEPPEHVIFILATTEAHKLPETIVSRTQRYAFKPVDKNVVADHLAMIAKKEKIDVDREALLLIAEHGEGSFRDSISLLDQLRHHDKEITLEDVQRALGIAPNEAIESVIQSIVDGQPVQLMTNINRLYETGYNPSIVAKQISESLQDKLIKNETDLDSQQVLMGLKLLLDVPSAIQPETMLELALLQMLYETQPKAPAAPLKSPKLNEPIPETKPKKEVLIEKSTPAPPKKSISSEPFDLDKHWPEVLNIIKKQYNTLYSILRMADPVIEDEALTLHFGFKFHQQRVNESRNKDIIASTMSEIVGTPFEVIAVYTPGAGKKDQGSIETEKLVIQDLENTNDPGLETITSIFGGSTAETES